MREDVMKDCKKAIFHMLMILAVSIISGYLLLVLAFSIPQSRIFTGLANSVSVLQRDDLEEKIFGYPSSMLDVFTDGAMLNAALYSNEESPFKRAVACYQYVYDDLSRSEAFIAYFEPREPDGSMPYVRYWHGILVILKPLFLFFNYSDIRMFNLIGQVVLICFTVYAFAIRKLSRYIPAVFVTYFFLMPFTLPMSIQYSPVFYIGFAALAVLVMYYDKLAVKDRLFCFFMLTGILTSYFDLLTYPVFTLGLPLTGLLILPGDTAGQKETETGAFGRRFITFILCGISWFAGYAGMWAGKLLVALPFYGTSAFTDAMDSAGKRSASGAADEGIGYADALRSNFFMYKNNVFRLCLIIYTLVIIGIIIYRITKRKTEFYPERIPMFLCVIAIPFVWYFVTTEHAQVHAFMTYKDLTVAVFAYCAGIVSLIGNNDRDKEVPEAE